MVDVPTATLDPAYATMVGWGQIAKFHYAQLRAPETASVRTLAA
eukprot:CAMPEP_0119375900 /NCGR_PEP_ID=MMETSP1334-20130426/37192_1 /TAXON_ID=127549 /ORGANISM="Calcidiscus leptoporus, Strain RCC1130" /LENGTH=43 /DNA_ID= /DNA_START= /DNA_END= /DNA_ORIENTATION=